MARSYLKVFAAVWFYSFGAATAQPLATPTPGQEKPQVSSSLKPEEAHQVASLFLGMCLDHLTRGELTWAEQACGEALRADPREPDAYKLRGYIYLMGHRFALAAQDFQAALRLRPGDDQQVAGYAQSLSGLGEFKMAVAEYRKALAIAPQQAAYWNGLCWSLAGEGRNLQEALKSCNHALALVPDAAGTLNSRAMVYLHMKRFKLAIADYSESLEVTSNQASAWFGRGLARLTLVQDQGASDIVEARRRDAGVDKLFIQMGVLQSNCSGSGISKPGCPKGFPPVQEGRSNSNVIAMLHADPDEQLTAAMTGSSSGLQGK